MTCVRSTFSFAVLALYPGVTKVSSEMKWKLLPKKFLSPHFAKVSPASGTTLTRHAVYLHAIWIEGGALGGPPSLRD